MAALTLTLARLREVLHYDPDTGVFAWRIRVAQHVRVGAISGGDNGNGYVRIMIDRRRYYAHRLAWLYTHGCWPSEIDHRNGVKTDNRITNLRNVSHRTNGENQRLPYSNNTTGFLGVSFDKGTKKYRAQIHINGRRVHVGLYATVVEAHSAYIVAKRELHSGNTL